MIDKSVLFEAKAFLCWDKFPQLSIKLIPINEAVAFFYPSKKNISTINIFYEKDTQDFSKAIFLLFHEAGHLQQWHNLSDLNREDEFWRLVEQDKGEQKNLFELQAWAFGESLLSEFIDKKKITNNKMIDSYKRFSKKCLLTYK